MMMGLLILGLAGGVTTGAAAALVGLPWWAAMLVGVVAGNLAVTAAAFLRLALDPRGRRARDLGHPEPLGRDAVGQATRVLGGMTLR